MIPTLDRWDALYNLLESLEHGTYKDFSVHIILDKNPSNIPEWLSESNCDLVLDKGSGSNSKLVTYSSQCTEGAVLGISDDSLFYPDCLEQAAKSMLQHFPDKMGMVGINQHIGGKPAGRKGICSLMNRKFIDHFPNRVIFCPDYIHFCADRELIQFALSIGCFYHCEAAKFNHLRLKDETTNKGRQHIPADRAMYEKRMAKGYLWGKNFDLIGGS